MTTLREVTAYWRNYADGLAGRAAQAQADRVDELQAALEARSQGPYSLTELAALGHPYAQRHAEAFLDPAVINVQGGLFADSWEVTSRPDGELLVTNTAPEAAFILAEGGTDTMIERPVIEAAREDVAESERALLADG